MSRFRRVADRWARYMDHIHMDIPEEQLDPLDEAESNEHEEWTR